MFKEKTGLNDTDIDYKYLEQMKSCKLYMKIILLKKKSKKELLGAIKLIMPIKKVLKTNYYQRKLN
jgi:hypothetical protein